MVPETYCFCRRCASRVEIGRVRLGGKLTCPACGLEFTASHQPRSHEAELPDSEEERDQRVAEVAGCTPPLRLFLFGVFGFPLRLQTLGPFLALAVGAGAAVAAFRLGIWCGSADSPNVDSSTRVLLWNGLLLSSVFGTMVLLAWTCAASAYGLTILRDTSHGCDAIEDWPRVLALEGLGASVYVVNALLLGTLPGLLATPLWHRLGVPGPLMIAIVAPALFPVFLLSMLETDSPTNPLSFPVWRSLWWAWRAWGLFYLISFAAVATVVAVLAVVTYYGGWAIDVFGAGVVIAMAWMVYFRLLGRLGWFCSGRFTAEDRHWE